MNNSAIPNFHITTSANSEESKEILRLLKLTLNGNTTTKISGEMNYIICEAELNCKIIHGFYPNVSNEEFKRRDTTVNSMHLYFTFEEEGTKGFRFMLYLLFRINSGESDRTISFSLQAEDTLFNYRDLATHIPQQGICQLINPKASPDKALRNVIWFEDPEVYKKISQIVQTRIQQLNTELEYNYFNYNFVNKIVIV